MDFLFYLLVVFLAIVSNSFITMILITLRVGLSLCNEISKSTDYKEHERIAASKLKNKYYLSLFIDTLIVIIIICIVAFLLSKYSLIYFITIVFFILISISKTGKNNQDNLIEFYNSLKENYPYYTSNND